MKRLRKLKDKAGFSLAEMLMTVLILMMVSLIVATGMPAAKNAYEKVVVGSNAQAMLSTAVSALRDELGTAWKVQPPESNSITYFKADTGTQATLSNTGVSEGSYPSIVLTDYVAVENTFIHNMSSGSSVASPRALVPDANTDLYVTYDEISYASGIVEIDGLKVCKQTDNTPLAKLDGKLKIRVLSVK